MNRMKSCNALATACVTLAYDAWSRTRARSAQLLGLAFAFAVMLHAVAAQAQVTELPDPGVDVGEYVTLFIAGLGGVVAIAIGGYFAISIIRVGIAWFSRLLLRA